jgi:hypothetical protein
MYCTFTTRLPKLIIWSSGTPSYFSFYEPGNSIYHRGDRAHEVGDSPSSDSDDDVQTRPTRQISVGVDAITLEGNEEDSVAWRERWMGNLTLLREQLDSDTDLHG